MFRAAIILAMGYGAGYVQGYAAGQNITGEVRNLIYDLRKSEETKKFLADLLVTMKEVADKKAEEDAEKAEAVDGVAVVEPVVEPVPEPSKP